MEIPKIIHYCWFGGKAIPDSVKKYIETWKAHFPDYTIKQWNENNFSIDTVPYARQAYDDKKFAFVADVARVYALYNEGGIYFDTDIEVIKNFEELLEGKELVLSNESPKAIMTGFFAAIPNHPFLKQIITYYQTATFRMDNGKHNMYPNTYLFREYAKNIYGVMFSKNIEQYENGLIVYPREYFTAYSGRTGEVLTTKNTVTIHHMEASWHPWHQKLRDRIKRLMRRLKILR